MSNLNNALLFLVNAIFSLYLCVLMVRLILAFARANYFDPITQVVIKLTQPLIAPLRRFFPTLRGVETATLLVIVVLEIIKITLLSLLTYGMPHVVLLLILACNAAFKLMLNTFFYAILLQAILSWVQPGSPASQFLDYLTTPIMRPLRRVIPPLGGFDITPIPAMLILQLLMILVP